MDNPLIYICSNSLQKKDATDLLKERIGFLEWTTGERILDIGCGPGDVTSTVLFPLLPKDTTLVACDISEEMIKYCSKFIKNDRISFKTQDIQQKEITNLQVESFNKIFSFYCLHWISDHRQAMQNIYSLLKPGGEILLMFITPDNPVIMTMNKLKDLDKWSKFIKDQQWFYKCDDPPSFFHDILKDVGFHNINCYLQKKNHHYPSLEALTTLLKAINPYLRYIPDELKSEYIQDMIDLLKQGGFVKYDTVNEDLIIEYNIIVAVAQKLEK
ncbi:juvenile hormone acid O-methyltransferase [Halyomorpha halys]|uniref:juvenile hormone acid O-methyltransferase n=1 Tax=Halyomorpha halys TaxID=286706 RepID=UPI0006D51ADC|nr:juvenile hormone acid O-methyltransferase [Halyomorpha halys]